MREMLELAWQMLPPCRKLRLGSSVLWIQLAVPTRKEEKRVNDFIRLANILALDRNSCQYIRTKFVKRRDAIHENLFCVIRVEYEA